MPCKILVEWASSTFEYNYMSEIFLMVCKTFVSLKACLELWQTDNFLHAYVLQTSIMGICAFLMVL